jgi:D-tagatose-1,6-bisphosphate aldolase subunit GatZ/KbaZ
MRQAELPWTEEAPALCEVVRRHKAGEPIGITSVCSADPLVLEAAMLQSAADGTPVLVEATSNQVDQTGGYTGMRPADFRDLVHGIARRCLVPAERVLLGGDHLGPNRWQHLAADEAIGHAEELVEAYVCAGFTKIHLDCSFPCAGDPARLPDEVVSARAVQLIGVAEAAPAAVALQYVIGTEVPAPGGERDGLAQIAPTPADAARRTLERHRAALAARGLDHVWPRVVALVVQPGVDFDHLDVIDYDREGTSELRHVLDSEPAIVFEAHSTDYQTAACLRALVEDHWAILKVGPALTFALREALFALAAIETELVAAPRRSRLLEVIDERMLAEPRHWRKYYPTGTRLERHYSYSDRLRYYWPDPAVAAARDRLLANLAAVRIPRPLLSQHLPRQYARVRAGELPDDDPRGLALDRIRDVLRDYARACSPR